MIDSDFSQVFKVDMPTHHAILGDITTEGKDLQVIHQINVVSNAVTKVLEGMKEFVFEEGKVSFEAFCYLGWLANEGMGLIYVI